ncbi:MAG: 4-phosphoerythronate dehydrogenase, partial [Muribaculum sp.]|nr:4-phosphoerythronate dehydrogenase [Muribaculum sp.]
MKVIIESKIPFIAGVLEPLGVTVEYLSPDAITPEAIRDADALIVRTRTKCDRALLHDSSISFIATATIGTDHLDLPYLRSRSITAVNAPGCNAPAVAQYVWAAIDSWQKRHSRHRVLTVGVVGAGHVGSIVAQWGESMGHRMLLCDPPRAIAEGSGSFTSLDKIAEEADIITFHTPLIIDGNFPTYHLFDRKLAESLKCQPLIINSSRGPVADTQALIDALDSGKISDAAIDTWEGEPDIDRKLLNRTFIATPHIAGYSLEGKKRATTMVLDALTNHFGLPKVYISDPAPLDIPAIITPRQIAYDPSIDTANLKAHPEQFELQRNNYPL